MITEELENIKKNTHETKFRKMLFTKEWVEKHLTSVIEWESFSLSEKQVVFHRPTFVQSPPEPSFREFVFDRAVLNICDEGEMKLDFFYRDILVTTTTHFFTVERKEEYH
jgi:hypothetical protein